MEYLFILLWLLSQCTKMQLQFGLLFLMLHTMSTTFPVLTNSISVNSAATLQLARSCLTYAQLQLNSGRVPSSKETGIWVLTCIGNFWIFRDARCQNIKLYDSFVSYSLYPPFYFHCNEKAYDLNVYIHLILLLGLVACMKYLFSF